MKATRVTETLCTHASSPTWWVRRAAVRLVDSPAGDVLTLSSGGNLRRHPAGVDRLAFVRPRAPRGAVAVTHRDVLLSDDSFTEFEHFATIVDDPEVRCQDGGCDPDGRLYVSTARIDGSEGGGGLYRIDLDGSVRQLMSGLTKPIGPVWVPSGERAYLIEAATGEVLVFDYDSESGLTGRRVLTTFFEHDGTPSGCCVDARGALWVAMNGAGTVRQLDTDGELIDMAVVGGVRQVTGCCLGGDLLDVLFITTARDGLADDEQPAAGAIHAVNRAGVGVAPFPFGVS